MELAALLERDMPTEVAELLERPTADNVGEARRRTREVRLDLDGRLKLDAWTPEVFVLSAENSLAEARAIGVGYWPPNPQEIPLLNERYGEAIKVSRELLEVVAPSGDRPFPGDSEMARDQFPAALAAIEESPERKRAAAVRAFNLQVEAFVLREVLSFQGSQGRYSSFGEYIEGQHEYLAAEKTRLIEVAGLTAEEEAAIDQRVTLVAMLAKAKHVVVEVSPKLSELLIETLPHRGEYPEGFLKKVRDMLAERLHIAAAADTDLEAMQV